MPNILIHTSFQDDKPIFDVQNSDQVDRHHLTPGMLSLKFDATQRYCTGWHDLETSESHVCPDTAQVDAKYEQCPACQRRTGFNPAFYNASSVSGQQDKLNHEPHILYLAYFAPSVIKVGISRAARGRARLFEQGARAACILATFPSALVARQYEAKISALDGMYEHMTARRKRELWRYDYSFTQAEKDFANTLATISDKLGSTFDERQTVDTNKLFFFDEPMQLSDVIETTNQNMISGKVVGSVGTDVIMKNDGHFVSLHLKHFTGYPVEISHSIEPLDLPPSQASLF